MLESVATDWSRVIDLYAGTGALGIEALSRGAGWADFVERRPRLCALIKENLGRTHLKDLAAVHCMTAGKSLSVFTQEYGVLLVDPPYDDTSVPTIAERLACSPLVGAESTIVIEHSRRTPLSPRYGDFLEIRSIRHGDSCVSFYQHLEVAS